jgi:drug/metabolite transporter (DMT)-like permease
VWAIGWGLAAAVIWGVASLVGARASRSIGTIATLAWLAATGLVVTAPFAVIAGWPDVAPATLVWLLVQGATTIGGLLLFYRALTFGKLGVLAPIVACDGALAGLYVVGVDGERLAGAAIAALALVAVGVVVVSARPDRDAQSRRPVLAVALAVGASLVFALAFVAAGKAAPDAGRAWVIVVPRIVGAVTVLVPVVLLRRLPLPSRADAPYVLGLGLLEPLGFACYVVATRDGVAVPAVLVTQSAAVSALLGYLVLGERLTRLQTAGAGITLAGVAALAAVQG